MIVYVLSSFVSHEGGSVVDVFVSAEAARRYVAITDREPSGDWEYSEEQKCWLSFEKEHRCFGMSIQEYEVKNIEGSDAKEGR